jgi:UPF0716 family protein affecting phage T7 exclusion
MTWPEAFVKVAEIIGAVVTVGILAITLAIYKDWKL